MPVITSIAVQKNDSTRCNLELDGQFYCGLKIETAVQNGLKKGMLVSEEFLHGIRIESEKKEAFDRALKHISASAKSEREIRTFLAGKGYLDEVIDDVVERMKRYGFLDDESYAKARAESLAKRKGSRLIAMDLRKRGISDETIEATLSQLDPEASETAMDTVLEKYLRGKPRDLATRRKAYAYLISRGFEYDAVRAALGRAFGEEP